MHVQPVGFGVGKYETYCKKRNNSINEGLKQTSQIQIEGKYERQTAYIMSHNEESQSREHALALYA